MPERARTVRPTLDTAPPVRLPTSLRTLPHGTFIRQRAPDGDVFAVHLLHQFRDGTGYPTHDFAGRPLPAVCRPTLPLRPEQIPRVVNTLTVMEAGTLVTQRFASGPTSVVLVPHERGADGMFTRDFLGRPLPASRVIAPPALPPSTLAPSTPPRSTPVSRAAPQKRKAPAGPVRP